MRTIRRLETDDRCHPHGQSLRLLADALGLSDAERALLVTVANDNPRRPGPARRSRSETEQGLPGAALLAPLPVGGPPAQLPADTSSFIGRAAELDELFALRPGKPGGPSTVLISAIDGMAGIGKTALAVRAGHRLAAHFPDGQLFVDLHGHTQNVAPIDPADALNRMLHTLGVPAENIPHHLDDRAALWRSIVAGRRMLIVLDNVSSEAQVSPLLPGTPVPAEC